MRAALLEAAPDQRRSLLESLVKEQVARVLGAVPAKLDVAKPLTELGLDSLMAVELKNWIEGDLRISLPTAELLRGPSVMRLTDMMMQQLSKHDGTPSGQQQQASASSAANQSTAASGSGQAVEDDYLNVDVESLSEAEVDALLDELAAQADRPAADS